MKNYHKPVVRISLIGIIVVILMISNGLFDFPFRLNQSLNGKHAIPDNGWINDSAKENFVGIDEINKEISKIITNKEMGNFFRMVSAYDVPEMKSH